MRRSRFAHISFTIILASIILASILPVSTFAETSRTDEAITITLLSGEYPLSEKDCLTLSARFGMEHFWTINQFYEYEENQQRVMMGAPRLFRRVCVGCGKVQYGIEQPQIRWENDWGKDENEAF